MKKRKVSCHGNQNNIEKVEVRCREEDAGLSAGSATLTGGKPYYTRVRCSPAKATGDDLSLVSFLAPANLKMFRSLHRQVAEMSESVPLVEGIPFIR